jgi:flagellar biosynthetic protein FliR
MLLSMLAQATMLALVASRISGFVVTSPFPGDRLPVTARLVLVVVLSFLAASFVPATAVKPEIGLPLFVAGTTEFLCGMLIGAAFRFLLAAADVVGGISAQSSGLGAASLYDPSIGAPDSAIGQVATILAILVALGVGAHRVAIAYLLESFRALPVGSPMGIPFGASVLVEVGGQCLVIGVRLAMPAIAVSLTVQAALAMVARAAPSLQIFSVGFSVMIAAGLAALMASLPAIGTGLAEQAGDLGPLLDRVFEALGAR